MGFLDYDDMFEFFPASLHHAVVMDPQQEGFDKERLVGVGQAIQFQDYISGQKIGNGELVLYIYDPADLAVAERFNGSEGRSQPVLFPALRRIGFEPCEHISHRRPFFRLSLVNTRLSVNRVDGLEQ